MQNNKAAAFGAKLAALEPDFDRQARLTQAIRANAKRRKAMVDQKRQTPEPPGVTAVKQALAQLRS